MKHCYDKFSFESTRVVSQSFFILYDTVSFFHDEYDWFIRFSISIDILPTLIHYLCYRFSFSCLFFLQYPILGLYGLQRGIVSTPSSKFKVKLNSVLNHSGRYGSRVGNTLGVFAVLYSLYEGLGDTVSVGQSICYIIL